MFFNHYLLLKNISLKGYCWRFRIIHINLILYTLNHFPNAFPFLGSVYENHGAFGLITSLRNQLLIEDIGVFINDYNFKSIMIGGDMRYPEIRSEVVIFDIFWWMGLVGIINTSFSFLRKKN